LSGCERWGVWWCAWISKGSSPFIALLECCGAGWRSTMARRFRWLVELGEGVAVFYVSRRGEWRRQLGRGGPGCVASFPCLPRPRRSRVSFSGGGGRGSWSGGCLAASRCRGDAQGVESGSRASAGWRRGAWPVTSARMSMRDVIGMVSALWARVVRRVSSSSSTTASVGGARVVCWCGLARWPRPGKKKGRGELDVCGMAGMAMP
jgi:hypothetical protein